jgi:hypothetical protein
MAKFAVCRTQHIEAVANIEAESPEEAIALAKALETLGDAPPDNDSDERLFLVFNEGCPASVTYTAREIPAVVSK